MPERNLKIRLSGARVNAILMERMLQAMQELCRANPLRTPPGGDREVVLKPLFVLVAKLDFELTRRVIDTVRPVHGVTLTVVNDSDGPGDGENEETSPPPADAADYSDSDVAADEGYQTLRAGILTPRHRRFCLLAAQGLSQKEIGEQLGYVSSRVSVLLRNPYIKEEIARIQERIYQETISDRLKSLVEPALATMEEILKDRTGRTGVAQKLDAAKFIVEKVDGKAIQKIDHASSALGNLIDRLDSLRGSGKGLKELPPAIDVTPISPGPAPVSVNFPPPRVVKSDEESLDDWVSDYGGD